MFRYKIAIKELFTAEWNGIVPPSVISSYADFYSPNSTDNDKFLNNLLGTASDPTVLNRFFGSTWHDSASRIFEDTTTLDNAWSAMFWKYFLPKAFDGYFYIISSKDTTDITELINEIRSKFFQMFGDKKDYYSQKVAQYLSARIALYDTNPITLTNIHTVTDAVATDTGFVKHSDTPTTSQNPTGDTFVSDRSDTSATSGARTHTDTIVSDIRATQLENINSQIQGVFSDWADYIINRYIILASGETIDDTILAV